MHSERFKMQSRTAYKLLAIFVAPVVIASLFSLLVGISLLLACGPFVAVLRSLTFQITVEDDGVYRDIVQLPIGIGRGKLVDYAEIESVEANPTENLMAEYVSPLYRYTIPVYSLSDSSDDVLIGKHRYFGGDIEGMVHIRRTDGTEVRLSSRNATEMASAVKQGTRASTGFEPSE
jgi:hypothetical protein